MDHFQVNFAARHHSNEMMGIVFIQQNIDRHMTCCSIQKIRKYINICENIHHHCNNLLEKEHNEWNGGITSSYASGYLEGCQLKLVKSHSTFSNKQLSVSHD